VAKTEEKQVTLNDYLRILNRRKWLILLCFLIFAGSAAAFSFLIPPVYQGRTTIMIEKEGKMEDQIFTISSMMQSETRIKNQVEILKSRTLAQAVVEAVFDSPFKNKFRNMMKAKYHSFPAKDQMIRVIQENLRVTPIRDTDIIEVKMAAPDPEMAAFLTNTVASEYYKQSLQFSRGEVSEVRQFLQHQLGIVQDSLHQAEEELKNYMESQEVSALPDETTELVKQLAEFESMLNEAKIELESNQKRLAYMKRQLDERKGQLLDEITQISTPVIQSLRNEMAELEAMRAEYVSQGVDENHPKMQQIVNRIGETKNKLIAETSQLVSSNLTVKDPLAYSQDLLGNILSLEIEIQSLTAKADGLQRIVNRYSAKMNQLPDKSLRLARLERSTKVGENIFLMLKEKYEEARIKEAGQIGNVRIIDKAVPPESPLKPKKKLNILLGALLGLLLGGGMALLLESLDSSLKSIEDVETLGVPVLGHIPKIKETEKKRERTKHAGVELDKEAREVASTLLTHFAPKSPVSEAYRTLRTNIQFSNLDHPPQTILVTSPGPGEGKSTTVANLAIAFSQMGTKTLLMDADFRRPIVHSLFGMEKEPGITNFLAGRISLEGIIKETSLENLDLVTCGVIPPNPSELLASQKMKEFVLQLKNKYQMILFDSPPVIAVTDAMVLSLILDGVVLVISSGQTSQPGLERAKTLLENVNAKVMGGVLNKMEAKSSYGSYHYYYYYHYYGEGDKRIKEKRRKEKRSATPIKAREGKVRTELILTEKN
jgi:polysaccharide chain length determinant protein (PEP-CTERM system associated)